MLVKKYKIVKRYYFRRYRYKAHTIPYICEKCAINSKESKSCTRLVIDGDILYDLCLRSTHYLTAQDYVPGDYSGLKSTYIPDLKKNKIEGIL